MTSPLRDRLADLLAAAVDQHHLVVWQDDRAEYGGIAGSVVPDDTAFAAYDGSWFALRHAIEDRLALSDPPKLVVHVPAPAPDPDPLAELRAAAHRFTLPLRDLVRDALRGQLPETQIEAIGASAATFAEAEQAAGTGVAPGMVPLVPVLGAGLSDTGMVVASLSGQYDDALDAKGAWPEVHRLLERVLGVNADDVGLPLRDAVARVLLLDAVNRAGALPERLQPALPLGSAAQATSRQRVLADWWALHPDVVAEAFRAADADTRLADDLEWKPQLAGLDIAPSFEQLAARHALQLISDREPGSAAELAAARNTGRWVRLEGRTARVDGGWTSRWRAIGALADLHRAIIDHPPPSAADTGAQLAWYAERGSTVDRAHRRLELALTALAEHGELEQPVRDARAAYEHWLTAVVERFTGALAAGGYSTGALLRQGDIHARFVAGTDRLTAYIWVDAFRFELAADVADALHAAGHTVELHAAVAAAPTITPVGMANLCPGAERAFAVDERGGTLSVSVAGAPVGTVDDRRSLLRGAHGDVADLELGGCVQAGEGALQKDIDGAKVVLVRSQELDAFGEMGLLSAAWTAFADTQATLPRVVAKLAKAGVKRVVITADHGFIALSRRLGDAYKVDAPKGGSGELHRRAWIGRGGVDHPSVLRVPLAATGVTSDVDLLVPRSLALFKAGGSKQFFHGGLSPQELVIPVVVANLAGPAETGKVKVGVDVVGGAISTGMFAASLDLTGNMFTTSVVVRVIARRGKELVVAKVVQGDGFDADSGTVTVPAGDEVRLMFQVTRRLNPDDQVEVQVLDARTDAVLGKAKVSVAAPISTFDDDLDE